MPLVAPLFVEDETTHSEVTVVNSSPATLDVDLAVSGPLGEALARRAIQMEPHSQRRLKVADLLRAESSWGAVYGSISLIGNRRSQLAAQLSSVALGKSDALLGGQFVPSLDKTLDF